MSTEQMVRQLLLESSELGIELSDQQALKLIEYLQMVIEKNKVLNLTRIVEPTSAVRLHLIDSLLFARYMNGVKKFLDLGTGAGFPGIPLCIVTDSRGVLLDSIHKKIDAVNEFITALSIGDRASAVADRVETFAISNRAQFDLVCARAVGQLDMLMEYASPLLRKDGMLVASKGNVQQEELVNAESVARCCGFELVSRETFELPSCSGHREMFVYKRSLKPKVKLPRRVGMAKSNPLNDLRSVKQIQAC